MLGYDSYIYNQYFDLTIDGAAGADDTTLAAINAIKAIPEKVGYEDRALVEAAREAYTKIATTQQQALVTNYADLISAEQRITALTPGEDGEASTEETTAETTAEEAVSGKEGGSGAGVVAVALALCAGVGGYLIYRKRKNAPAQVQKTEEPVEETAEAEGSEEAEISQESQDEEESETESEE